jgi:predicted phage terminase large subunit-like protein
MNDELFDDFTLFFKEAWHIFEGSKPYVHSQHIRVIAEHLEAAYRREIKTLIINIPPRSSKTNLISIAFPAWVWLHNPEEKFLYASYASNLSAEHSRKCRQLIESPWYKSLSNITLRRATEKEIENTQGGCRIATSVGGVSTGKGASILVADDPNNVQEIYSKTKRETIHRWWSQVIPSRLNDPKRDVKIMVQQRCHEDDLTGYILKTNRQDVTHLVFPNEYEGPQKFITKLQAQQPDLIDKRKTVGELLCQERLGLEETERLKREIGEYGYAGQYQQRPAPLGGGIIKREWFGLWKKISEPIYSKIIQSWDTAFKDGEENDYSVCSTWGIFSSKELGPSENTPYNCIMLLSLWQGKAQYPELRKRAVRLSKNYLETGDKEIGISTKHTPDTILMEDKASGQSLAQDLRNAGLKIYGINPTTYGDKLTRVHLISSLVENGLVFLQAPNKRLSVPSQMFLDEILSFPNGANDDIVDTFSQVMIHCKTTMLLRVTNDPRPKDDHTELERDITKWW